MTQEERQLLFKDLCGRMPYHPFVYGKTGYAQNEGRLTLITSSTCAIITAGGSQFHYFFDEIKPYLRPMSSMTVEESEIFNNISNKGKGFEEDEDGWIRCDSIHTKWGVWPDGCAKLLDYLNSIHVDYRGLIPMGLALEAKEGMYEKESV